METVTSFCVIVLRHNPVDSKPINIPAGAMDPTGPVFWLDYWPKRDPSHPNEREFLEEEQRLEFALVAFTERSKGDKTVVEIGLGVNDCDG